MKKTKHVRLVSAIKVWVLFLVVGVIGLNMVGVRKAFSESVSLTVAVATNFMQPFNEAAVLFEKQTGIRVTPTFASTGKLYGQIINGAPYDMFLAADERRPGLLYDDKLCETPFVYAGGAVVVWTANRDLCRYQSWQDMLRDPAVRYVAVANPKNSPYGSASKTALVAAGLWEPLRAKWVFPQSIAQAFQYAHTESADVGLCAYSSALSDKGTKGCWHAVPEAPSIIQAACILVRTPYPDACRKLADFLNGSQTAAIKSAYGYR